MFTTGSKLFVALTALSVVSFAVYMVLINPSSIGATALFGLVAVGIFLVWMALYTRDAENVAEAESGANAAVPSPSMWPLVAVIGAVMMLVGTVTTEVVFILGMVAVAASFVEWMIQAWADRASSEPAYNASVRKKILNPIEFPVIATLGLAVVILSFAQIMLAVERSAGAVIFMVLASWVLAAGTLFALRPGLKKGIVTTVAVVGSVGIVAAGVLATSAGLRPELVEAAAEGHYTQRDCGPKKSKYGDKLPLEAVSSRSGVIATVEFINGTLVTNVQGITGPQEYITIPRSNPSSILFRNKSDGDYRLVAVIGKSEVSEGVTKVDEVCTQLIEKGMEQILTLTLPKPTVEGGEFYLYIAGLDGQRVELVVPL
jgi:hypothetical protein